MSPVRPAPIGRFRPVRPDSARSGEPDAVRPAPVGRLRIALLAAWVWALPASAQTAPLGGSTPMEASPAPHREADFRWRLRSLDGEETTLASFHREVLFINLWASWCTPCVRELGSIERLRARLADTDVRFLIVAAEGEGPVRRFLRRYRYDLPFYLEASRIPGSFGARGIPTSWIVDRDGRIVRMRHGEAVWDSDEVETLLRHLAADVPSS